VQLLDFSPFSAFSGLFQPFQSQPSLTGAILMPAARNMGGTAMTGETGLAITM
jgi:hypothetical protein